MSHAVKHPLDIDLADFAGDLVEDARREALEDHLGGCRVCRIKVRRLRDALSDQPKARFRARSGADVSAGLSVAAPQVSVADVRSGRPAPGQLWAAETEERLLVLVLGERHGRVVVVPVTFDVGCADDETIVVPAALSPFEMAIAVYPALPAELPRFSFVACFGQLVEAGDVDRLLAGALPGTARGEPIDGPTDLRLEFRQMLADQLGALEQIAPGPGIAADAPCCPNVSLRCSRRSCATGGASVAGSIGSVPGKGWSWPTRKAGRLSPWSTNSEWYSSCSTHHPGSPAGTTSTRPSRC